MAPAKRYQDIIVFGTERWAYTLQQQAINGQFISLPQTGVAQKPRSKKTCKSRHSSSQRKTSREINTLTQSIFLCFLVKQHDYSLDTIIKWPSSLGIHRTEEVLMFCEGQTAVAFISGPCCLYATF